MTPSSFEERFDELRFLPPMLLFDGVMEAYEEGWKMAKSQDKAFIKSELDNQRVEIEGELKSKILGLEVRGNQRYLSDSGFWSSRETVAKDEVLTAISDLLRSKT